MEFVTTRDGSPTIYDPAFKEHHHSLVGAYTEARFKFAEVARPLLVSKTHIKLLDLPFGLGYNLIATLNLLNELPQKTDCKNFVECVAIEKDFEVIKAIASCPFAEDLQKQFDLLKPFSQGQTKIHEKNFSAKLIVDDLLMALPNLNETFDLIYYDAFSPKVAHELWSKENVLRHFARLMHENSLLITYTGSNKVRKGLLEVGLNISPGPCVGRKMGGTIASKGQLVERFSEETWIKIQNSISY